MLTLPLVLELDVLVLIPLLHDCVSDGAVGFCVNIVAGDVISRTISAMADTAAAVGTSTAVVTGQPGRYS